MLADAATVLSMTAVFLLDAASLTGIVLPNSILSSTALHYLPYYISRWCHITNG